MNRLILINKSCLIFFISVFIFSCSSGGGGNSPKFDISGAKAFVLVKSKQGGMNAPSSFYEKNSDSNSQNSNCRLLKINNADELVPVCDESTISNFEVFKGGVFVSTVKGNYLVFPEGEPVGVEGYFLGVNEQGDVILSNASIYRASSKSIEKIQTNFSDPYFARASGNFVMLESWSMGERGIQVLDTISLARYNIANCNGSRVAALSKHKLLVDDCGPILMDIRDGSRTEIAGMTFGPEFLSTSDGAVFLGWCPGGWGENWLCHVDSTGENVTNILTTDLNPNFGYDYKNTALFGTGDYFVVKELNKITAVRVGVDSPIEILSGVNVISISVKGSSVYYVAEDYFGKKITGVYDLSKETDFIFDINEEVEKIEVAL